MNTRRTMMGVICSAVLIFSTGYVQGAEVNQQKAGQGAGSGQLSRCVTRGDLVVSIDGINVNYPDSEKLNWIEVTDPNSVDPKFAKLGLAHVEPSIAAKHTLRVYRYATIREYVLLCASFDPLFPDGSFNWVVNKNAMTYEGHFLDKDSR